MMNLKVLPLLTLVFLMGCGSDPLEIGDYVMIHRAADQEPYSARIISQTSEGYLVEKQDGQQENIASNHVLTKLTDASQEMIIKGDWRDKVAYQESPAGKNAKIAKSQVFHYAVLPLLLLSLTYLCKYLGIITIPWVLIIILSNPFMFFSTMIVFIVLSFIALFFLIFFLGGFNACGGFFGSMAYLILLLMFFLN